MSTSTERRRAARTLSVVWVVVVLGVLAAGWLLTEPLEPVVDPWDDSVVGWLEDRRTDDLDTAAAAGSAIADTVVGVALAALVGVAGSWWQRSWRPFVYFAVLVLGYLALYVIVTHLVPRDRPPVEILDPGLVPDHSFPSGHVATSIVVYGGIVLWVAAVVPRWRRWVWPLLLAPLVVAPSRLYQGAHHPTDVMASLVFATVWVLVVARVILPRPVDERRQDRTVMVDA
ncbi:MAG TPA: phosphatase PAP2 family protein [Nocardioides sp.]|nr:phosphatase PAP2 family protein [Nocardioides sp.]